jgi:FkbM family methyltransferase
MYLTLKNTLKPTILLSYKGLYSFFGGLKRGYWILYLQTLLFSWLPSQRALTKRCISLYRSMLEPNQLCFDIGANLGNRVSPLLQVGAKVVALEPNEECVQTLTLRFPKALRSGQLSLIQKGVYQTEGTKSLFISADRDHVYSSMNPEHMEKYNSERQTTGYLAPCTVQVTTLDQLISEYGIPQFCKIDVEGSELAILKGLHAPISYLCFEYHTDMADEAIACIQQLSEIAPYRFNVSKQERMRLLIDRWLPLDEMIAWIHRNFPLEIRDFGDIYAHFEAENKS